MAETGKIPDEEVVNNQDQEGGDLQKDATCPSHRDGSVKMSREWTTPIDSESEKLGNDAFEDASFLGAYSSVADIYTSMIVGGNPEEGSESVIRTPSMQPVVDTNLSKRGNPFSTTHNSELGSYSGNVTTQHLHKKAVPVGVPCSASSADPSLADVGVPYSASRADPSLADGYNYRFRGNPEEGSDSWIRNPSTTHNSKSLRIDDQLSNREPTKSVVGSSSSKTIQRKKKKGINCFPFWSKKSD